MSGPYQYSSPLPFYSDVWGPMDVKTGGVLGAQQAPEPRRPPREPLNAEGQTLIDRLPPKLSLSNTALRYPHIVNALALVWNDSKGLAKYVDSLLVDDRIKRQGFEFATLSELTDVRNIRLAQLRAFEAGRPNW